MLLQCNKYVDDRAGKCNERWVFYDETKDDSGEIGG